MKKVSALFTSAVVYLSVVHPTFAAVTINPCPSEPPAGAGPASNFNPLCSLRATGGLVNTLITVAFVVATLVALGFLIFGGIKWITSGGDKAGVEAARNTIVAALVGLVIVFLSYLIINFIFQFFGLGSFGNLYIPNLKVAN